ncbi:hypothetical protein [Maribellus mangrovi]|uniref:hypothetical protein n=1 Tax=Maribellus mangrovi TaxID=3133146 RepID=UPI0030EF4BEE
MKTVFYWLLAIVITLAAAIYQRTTGPTYPKKFDIEVNGNIHELRLIRSVEIGSEDPFKLAIDDNSIEAKLYYRQYLSHDEYTEVDFAYAKKPVDSFIMNKIFGITEEEGWFADIPDLPAAGKIQYYFEVKDNNGIKAYFKDEPIIVRYKGAVPPAVLTPHIFFMFFAMLLGNLAGIMAVFNHNRFKFYTTLTIIAFFIGGMILGPIVQLYAFGEAWAGIPFAWDLTDNKTLIAFLFWLLAFAMNRNKRRPIYTVVAAVVMLLVYSIPHSMYGSELDPETGEIIQGWIQLFLF